MATYKKRLKNRNGDTIIPDVGIDLGAVVYSDDPTTTVTMPSTKVINSFLTSLQSTTSTTGVNVNTLNSGQNMGSISFNTGISTRVVVCATFPLSTSSSSAMIDLYLDGSKAWDTFAISSETTSQPTTGWALLTLSAGSHTLGFKLRANSGQTAYLGSYRTISVMIMPIIM